MLFGRTLLQWGWGQECQEQEGSQGLVFRAGKQQCSSRLQHLALLQKGWEQLPAAATWLGKKSSGTELGHRLLHSLPNEAVAWVSCILPPVFKPAQKIDGSVFIQGGLVLHWTRAEDNGTYPWWPQTDFLWSPCNEAIYPAQGWALSPISEPDPWMEHSWAPHQASHSHSTDVALCGGHDKVTASGFVGEVLAISFFPAMSNLSNLQRKSCSELQPRQNQGRKHFKDFLLYNILQFSELLSCRCGVLCVSLGVRSGKANSQGDKTNPRFSPHLLRNLCPI